MATEWYDSVADDAGMFGHRYLALWSAQAQMGFYISFHCITFGDYCHVLPFIHKTVHETKTFMFPLL